MVQEEIPQYKKTSNVILAIQQSSLHWNKNY